MVRLALMGLALARRVLRRVDAELRVVELRLDRRPIRDPRVTHAGPPMEA